VLARIAHSRRDSRWPVSISVQLQPARYPLRAWSHGCRLGVMRTLCLELGGGVGRDDAQAL
jgi:hypothetical protein